MIVRTCGAFLAFGARTVTWVVVLMLETVAVVCWPCPNVPAEGTTTATVVVVALHCMTPAPLFRTVNWATVATQMFKLMVTGTTVSIGWGAGVAVG